MTSSAIQVNGKLLEAAAPEPSTLALAALGVAGVFVARRRRAR